MSAPEAYERLLLDGMRGDATLFTRDDEIEQAWDILDTTLNDFGRWVITQHSEDSLLFKVPSLRNIGYTFPYMHDGRFKKLQQVLDHYTGGIRQNKTLSKKLKRPIVLSSEDRENLIAFLLALNDREFVFNPKHNYPGKK